VDGELVSFVHLEDLLREHCSVQVDGILMLGWLFRIWTFLLLIVFEWNDVVTPVIAIYLLHLNFFCVDLLAFDLLCLLFAEFLPFGSFYKRWNQILVYLEVQEVLLHDNRN